jgi:hypothetical protein
VHRDLPRAGDGGTRFRTRSLKLNGGQRTVLHLTLTRSALVKLRGTLRRRSSVLVRVDASAVDAAGNRSVAQAKRIRLRR